MKEAKEGGHPNQKGQISSVRGSRGVRKKTGVDTIQAFGDNGIVGHAQALEGLD